jgi:phage terminase large subunit-like protein
MTDTAPSMAARFAALPEARRKRIFAALSVRERQELEHLWAFWARPAQLAPPGNWRVWLILAGRAWGKSRAGAEWVRGQVQSKRCGRLALCGATAADARDVMVEGESGLLAISPPWFRPTYEPSKRRLTWPNGAIATLYSADEPDRLRGPQHDGAWADEIAAWRYPEAWDQLQFGLRLGDPRVVATTTPRPTPLVRALIEAPTTHATRGTTYENRDNLPASYFDQILAKYEGTRLGRQELLAEILDDNPGALFARTLIDDARVRRAPDLLRVVVAIDPAVSHDITSDETGIIVAGLGVDLHAYVLDDLSGRFTPSEWGKRAVDAYFDRDADRIIAEVNQGGDMVEANLRTIDPTIAYKAVRASRGKHVRAEPVAGLYEQGRVHHVGMLPELEDQMVSWDPTMPRGARSPARGKTQSAAPVSSAERSPDRLDALVWAMTELMLEAQPVTRDFENLPPG